MTYVDIRWHMYILAGMEELLTLPQVAKLLGLAERTIYVWSQQGKIPAFKLGTAWRYRAGEIDKWVEAQRSDGSHAPLTESRKFGFEKRKENEVRVAAMISACEAFIKHKTQLSDNETFILDEFEDEFEHEILAEALNRLTKSKEFDLDTMKIGKEKIKVLVKKGSLL